MKDNKLKLALEETEAVILKGYTKKKNICFKVKETRIVPSKLVKHLRIWLNVQLSFSEHINKNVQNWNERSLI